MARVFFRELDPRAGNQWQYLGQTAAPPQLDARASAVGSPSSSPHWQGMTIVYLAHGQARAYADHVDVLEVTFTGGHPAATDGTEFPWGSCPPSHTTMVKQHVKGYVGWSYDKTLGETGEFHQTYLAECEHVAGDTWSNTWRLRVVQPYVD